jgi:hypothetical protein
MTDQKRNKFSLRFPSSANFNTHKEENGPSLTRGSSSSKLTELQSENKTASTKPVQKSRSEVVESKSTQGIVVLL